MALKLMPRIGLSTDNFEETHSLHKARRRSEFLPYSPGSFRSFRFVSLNINNKPPSLLQDVW